MDTVEAHAALQPHAALGRTPVSLPSEEADQFRAAGWTEAQIAAGRRNVAQPCRRCGGGGHLPGFRHVDGGRCFGCHATGADPKPTTEYAPSVRSKLDERAARRRNAKEAKRHAAFDGWLAQRPELAAALERAEADIRAWTAWDGCQETPKGGTTAKLHTPIAWNPFLAELTWQLRRREPLGDRQADFYVRRVVEVTRQGEQEREREARRVPAPEGTVTFTGTVATIRSQPGYLGRAELKMLVIAEATDGGGEFRVWCTVPRRGEPFGEGAASPSPPSCAAPSGIRASHSAGVHAWLRREEEPDSSEGDQERRHAAPTPAGRAAHACSAR